MFHSVLFPVDLSAIEFSEAAAERVLDLAKCHHSEVRLLGVIPDVGMPIVGLQLPRASREKILEEAVALLNEFGEKHFAEQVPWKAKVREGRAHKEILRESRKKSSDLIILPSHHRKGVDQVIGSVAERVAEHAACSVLLLR